uniref:SRCR domain-containing protein n=1 Tax=Pinctada fucata TaxID=50426 RepID=A0A194AP14_PINFU
MNSFVILSMLSLITTSKCQALLTSSSETLRGEKRVTDILRSMNNRLQEEIRHSDARVKRLEATVNSLSSRISSLENGKDSTLSSKVSGAEQWIAGQKTGYGRLVRLVNGGSSYGRLEVNIDGHGWGNVCDDNFGSTEATVVCRQLGYRNGVVKKEAYYGEGSLDIIMDDVDCLGSENAIQNCRYVGKDKENCGHSEDVGVSCS